MVTEGSSHDGHSLQAGSGWVRLLHGVHSSFDLRKLVLASIGLLLLQGGWSFLDLLFPGFPASTLDLGRLAVGPPASAIVDLGAGVDEWVRSAGWRLSEPWRALIVPLRSLLSLEHGAWRSVHAILVTIWTLFVWGIVGGMLARRSLIEIGRLQRPTTLRPLRFAIRFGVPLVVTPLYPLGVAGLCALGCAVFGSLYWLPLGIGPVLGLALHFIPLALGLVIALLLVGMVAAWPLMVSSVAAECEDALDALSRSFSYVNQRIGKFVACVSIAWLVGIPALLAVDLLSRAVPHLALWGLSLAAPVSRLADFDHSLAVEAGSPWAAVALAGFWQAVLGLLQRSWIYVYFWTSAASIYVLLRNDVDGTPWNNVSSGPYRESDPGSKSL
jgi:hypothetical protein